MHLMEMLERDWVIHGFMLLPKGMMGHERVACGECYLEGGTMRQEVVDRSVTSIPIATCSEEARQSSTLVLVVVLCNANN